MSWIEKRQRSSLDEHDIEGLHYLDGAVLARLFMREYGKVETPLFRPEWIRDQKFPQIEFPSGLTFDIWETSSPEKGGIVHIFGEMDLPYFDTRESAWELANDIAEQVGYRARKRGESQLEVRGDEAREHFLITYDDQQRRIADIALIKAEQTPSQPKMKSLLDQASRERLPKLYTNEEIGLDALAQVKFFTPSSNWTWYASEASAAMKDGTYKALTEVDANDPDVADVIFFGVVDGFELELGYFSLSELEGVGGGLQLSVERDRHFTPTTLRQLQNKRQGDRHSDLR